MFNVFDLKGGAGKREGETLFKHIYFKIITPQCLLATEYCGGPIQF
jgi:hypothetical protein